jgi:DNA-binding LacI/PurR family transcriptional regulator
MTEKHIVTIYDIVREARVSTATVFRVINRIAAVSTDKRADDHR